MFRTECIGYSWVTNDAAAQTTPPRLGDSLFLCRVATSSDSPAEMREPTPPSTEWWFFDRYFFPTIFLIFFDETFFEKFFSRYLCRSKISPGVQKSYLEIRAVSLTMRKSSPNTITWFEGLTRALRLRTPHGLVCQRIVNGKLRIFLWDGTQIWKVQIPGLCRHHRRCFYLQ